MLEHMLDRDVPAAQADGRHLDSVPARHPMPPRSAATVTLVGQPAGHALLGTSLAPSLLEPVEAVDMPRRIARRALDLLPGLAEVSITRGWYGLRPMSPDGLPLVGPTAVEGLFVHGGHGSIGMQSAPWTAR